MREIRACLICMLFFILKSKSEDRSAGLGTLLPFQVPDKGEKTPLVVLAISRSWPPSRLFAVVKL